MALNYAPIYFPNGKVSKPSLFQINNLLTSERRPPPPPESNSQSAIQEMHHLLLNQKIHYHVHISLLKVPILDHSNPVYNLYPLSLMSLQYYPPICA
jgi:hypothetical protein